MPRLYDDVPATAAHDDDAALNRGARSACVVAIAVLVASGCRARDTRPDVVLVVLDAARADHLSAYGYERRTTPRLDRLASEGVLYRTAISAATWTVPSHASLFTGRLPMAHGAYHAPDGPNAASGVNPNIQTLAERLKAVGYDTAAFVGNKWFLDPRYGFARGFDLYRTDDVRPAARLAHHVTRWLRRKAGRPAFVFMNVMDTHEPYAARPPYDRLFPGRQDEDPGDVTARFLASHELPDAAVLRHCVSQYDGELRYVDDQLGLIFDTLEELGRYDNALIIVTSDHGEMFGEHGALGHGGPPYHTVLWVPLIVKYPHGNRRGVEEGPVSSIAVAPTVLAELGLAPLEGARGRPLWERGEVVVAEEVTPTGDVHRAAYDDSGRVLLDFVAEGKRVLGLYDLHADLRQEHPLAAANEAAGDRLRKELDAVAATPAVARGAVVLPDARTRERLRALGYVQ